MSKSLQDQLLGMGLVSNKQVQKANTEKRKQHKSQNKGKKKKKPVEMDENQKRIIQAQIEKAAKDRELNEKMHERARKKAASAQVTQMIKSHRIKKDQEGEAFSFQDGSKVKRIFISAEMRSQIIQGKLGVAKLGDQYEVVAKDIALKIRERDASRLIILNDTAANKTIDESDPYAQYQVPDDLTW